MSERDRYSQEVLELRNLLMKTEEQWQSKFSKIKQDYETCLAKVNFNTFNIFICTKIFYFPQFSLLSGT